MRPQPDAEPQGSRPPADPSAPARPTPAAPPTPSAGPRATPARRDLLAAGLAAPLVGSGLARATSARPQDGAGSPPPGERAFGRFHLQYAPHFGMFRHHAGPDPVDQLKHMHAEGFRALEDNGMPNRPVAEQERIGAALRELGMTMGVFVAHADFGQPTFVRPPAEARERIEADLRRAIEVADRVGARWCTVVPGTFVTNREWDYQTANVIDNLRFAAELLEPHDLCMVLEPLNPWRDHPNLFLTKVPQAYALCRAVNSPSCKILDDLYHQQITEGNLSGNLDRAWSEIAYIQVGDHPGRREPGTGEIHYRHLFRQLARKGFRGVVGMEHGIAGDGIEGERALVEAYVRADDFEL